MYATLRVSWIQFSRSVIIVLNISVKWRLRAIQPFRLAIYHSDIRWVMFLQITCNKFRATLSGKCKYSCLAWSLLKMIPSVEEVLMLPIGKEIGS